MKRVETEGGPVEIEMTEEGGAEVSFDPKAASPKEGGEDHFENLGEFLGEDSILDPLGSKLVDQYNEYRESRARLGRHLTENGLDLLGFKYERRTEPFRGCISECKPSCSC